jgi:hypothetical protein
MWYNRNYVLEKEKCRKKKWRDGREEGGQRIHPSSPRELVDGGGKTLKKGCRSAFVNTLKKWCKNPKAFHW